MSLEAALRGTFQGNYGERLMKFYRRNLPHWQPMGAEYFVTFRLIGTLPSKVVEWLKSQRNKLREADSQVNQSALRKHIQRKIFQKYEHLIDGGETGPKWLKQEEIADIIYEAIHFRDTDEYDLYAYCIMPNHVHMVVKLLNASGSPGATLQEDRTLNYPLTNVLQRLKSYTAVHANKVLGRTGQFWQNESFDRMIRNADELERTIAYTLNNPVKAELVDFWEEWPYSYCKDEFLPTFGSR